MRSARGLARYLKRLTAQNAPSGPELARTAMEEKVDRVCRTGRNIDTDRLEKIILSHALKRHRRVGGKTLRRLARKVAQENGLRCGHLDVKTADLTF